MHDLLVGARDQGDLARGQRVLRRVVGQLRLDLLQDVARTGKHLDGVGDHQVDHGGDVCRYGHSGRRRADLRGDFVTALERRLHARAERVDSGFGEEEH